VGWTGRWFTLKLAYLGSASLAAPYTIAAGRGKYDLAGEGHDDPLIAALDCTLRAAGFEVPLDPHLWLAAVFVLEHDHDVVAAVRLRPSDEDGDTDVFTFEGVSSSRFDFRDRVFGSLSSSPALRASGSMAKRPVGVTAISRSQVVLGIWKKRSRVVGWRVVGSVKRNFGVATDT
jgi:hypothetical protein